MGHFYTFYCIRTEYANMMRIHVASVNDDAQALADKLGKPITVDKVTTKIISKEMLLDIITTRGHDSSWLDKSYPYKVFYPKA